MTKPLLVTTALLLGSCTLFGYEDHPDQPQQTNNHQKILERFDKDGDNQISKAEAPPKMKRRFDKHDLDGDGYIANEELDTLPRRKPNNQQRPPRNQSDSNQPPQPQE
jgi:Ca2+-binding EF-hand superfamily protein